MLPTADIACPYCGEVITILVDVAEGEEQHYIEDCQVCCRPIALTVALDAEGEPIVNARAEDDT